MTALPVRVQRVPEQWPVVHLESEIPEWEHLVIDGHVAHARRFPLTDLAALGADVCAIDFHCVWGWSRPAVQWTGVPVSRLLTVVGAQGSHVTVQAASNEYSACLPLEDAARGILAWARDGEALAPEEVARCGSCRPPSCGATRA